MANKDRQKRSVRQARAREREALEAAQVASGQSPDPKGSAKAEASRKSKELAKKDGFIASTRTYLQDVRTEMHRVVWPSKTELTNYSAAVIASLVLFGFAVWMVDTGFVAILVAFTGLRG